MSSTQLATRIDLRVKKMLEKVCDAKGLKMSHFIEEAIIDKIEEIADLEELKTLRQEATIPLSEAIEELKKHGKL